MEKLTMCRICLAQDVRMYSIVNTHLEDMYQKLNDRLFITNDMRPTQVCYICCARLRNCYQLKTSCLQSEELFTQILGTHLAKPDTLLQIPRPKILSKTPVTYLSMGCPVQNAVSDIKMEVPEKLDDVKIKTESAEDHKEVEREDTDSLQANKIPSSDPKNDNPLIFIKIEPVDIVADTTDLEEVEFPMLPKSLLEDTATKKLEEIQASDKKNKNYNHRQTLKNKSTNKFKENCEQCDVCKKYFKSIFNHNCSRINMTCDVCKKKFSSANSLNAHKRIHSGEKPYSCVVCNKSFSDRSTLNQHKFVHTMEKPYICGTCGKGFKRKTHLATHVLVHDDIKPYECEVCKKCFSQKVHLVGHIRVHTGDKLFKCDMCKNAFSDRSCLIRHMRRAHCL